MPATYPVRVAAERLGIPTATLRSWNQRYGVGPRPHRPGGHRLYSDADITAIARMVALVRTGASPAAAARTVGHDLPSLEDSVDPLLQAAFTLDCETATALIERNIDVHGVVETWERLCRPAFGDVVARQSRAERCVDVEHVLSRAVSNGLRRVHTPARQGRRPILLACAPAEQHTLPLEALRAALAERGTNSQMLGADLPVAALGDSIERSGRSSILMLWSHTPFTANPYALRAPSRTGATVIAAGPGWSNRLSPWDSHVSTLTEAIDRLHGCLRGRLARAGSPLAMKSDQHPKRPQPDTHSEQAHTRTGDLTGCLACRAKPNAPYDPDP
ncbi:MerR family transcriptional regulator [Nocardia pseudobrasiliensis]|uniref:MerR-like DNA binding protein n=1 Tax=Nocardia pseudobrasiliensis TaxID=45979 RepID=A0A370HPN8_9NOCA|nr:MerR family transcriptional regulator [Nocardia pseudobrasiliensis]RDI60543.1 MerR-like DNA binding protein [Nocardia pseudobrasiliensis]